MCRSMKRRLVRMSSSMSVRLEHQQVIGNVNIKIVENL